MAPTLSNRSSFSSSLSSQGAMGLGSGGSMGGFRSGMGMGMSNGMGMGMGMGMAMRSGSVHGGAGGKGIRISNAGSSGRLGAMGGGFGSGGGGGGGASFSAFSVDASAGGETAFGSTNEKSAMQNLNHRLSQYLEKVRFLEEANAKLEEQIKNWGISRLTVETRDFSTHLTTIDEIRTKIHAAGTVVAELALEMDNTKLAADDFRIKFENELSLRQSVEADIGGLKRMLGEMTLVKADLELELDNLKEELVYMKKNQEEEKIAMQTQLTGQIQVEVDAAPGVDLNHVISEIREQYEGMVAKNRRDAEAWFKAKAEVVEQEVRASTEVLQTSSVELKSGQTTVRDLELELQSLFSMRASMEANLADVEGRYGAVMMGLQTAVVSLEGQLTQIRADTEHTSQEYQALLDIKIRLEMEIAEYRRLLEGEDAGFAVKSGITSAALDVETSASTQEVESVSVSSSSTVTAKVVTVVQEVVDGELVSSSSTTTTEEVTMES